MHLTGSYGTIDRMTEQVSDKSAFGGLKSRAFDTEMCKGLSPETRPIKDVLVVEALLGALLEHATSDERESEQRLARCAIELLATSNLSGHASIRRECGFAEVSSNVIIGAVAGQINHFLRDGTFQEATPNGANVTMASVEKRARPTADAHTHSQARNGSSQNTTEPLIVKNFTTPVRPDKGRSWQDKAKCKDEDPDLFSGEGGKDLDNRAKRVCGACAVRLNCLAFAMANIEETGVRGGTTQTERRKIKRRQAASRA